MQDYVDHTVVKQEDRGFIFDIEGTVSIDLNRLIDIYNDKFWKHYPKWFKDKEKWIS